MVEVYVKVIFYGFVLAVIGAGVGSTFIPQLQPEKRDFTIKSTDKKYVESLPKNKYWQSIDAAIKSDKPFFGGKPSKD